MPALISFTWVFVSTLILRESLAIRAAQLSRHSSIRNFRPPWILTVRTTNKPLLDLTASSRNGINYLPRVISYIREWAMQPVAIDGWFLRWHWSYFGSLGGQESHLQYLTFRARCWLVLVWLHPEYPSLVQPAQLIFNIHISFLDIS